MITCKKEFSLGLEIHKIRLSQPIHPSVPSLEPTYHHTMAASCSVRMYTTSWFFQVLSLPHYRVHTIHKKKVQKNVKLELWGGRSFLRADIRPGSFINSFITLNCWNTIPLQLLDRGFHSFSSSSPWWKKHRQQIAGPF